MATLVLDDELHRRLQHLADVRAQTPEAIVREALDQMVQRDEVSADFVAEAEASWDKFQRDGHHLTGDEVSTWLRDWEKGSPLPPCHD